MTWIQYVVICFFISSTFWYGNQSSFILVTVLISFLSWALYGFTQSSLDPNGWLLRCTQSSSKLFFFIPWACARWCPMPPQQLVSTLNGPAPWCRVFARLSNATLLCRPSALCLVFPSCVVHQWFHTPCLSPTGCRPSYRYSLFHSASVCGDSSVNGRLECHMSSSASREHADDVWLYNTWFRPYYCCACCSLLSGPWSSLQLLMLSSFWFPYCSRYPNWVYHLSIQTRLHLKPCAINHQVFYDVLVKEKNVIVITFEYWSSVLEAFYSLIRFKLSCSSFPSSSNKSITSDYQSFVRVLLS